MSTFTESQSSGTAERELPKTPFGAPHVFVFVIVEGPDLGATHRLAEDETIIGREQGADFQLGDEAVSGAHVRIRVDGSVCSIMDLESRNGTRLNEQPLRPRISQAFAPPRRDSSRGHAHAGADRSIPPTSPLQRALSPAGRWPDRSPAPRVTGVTLVRWAGSALLARRIGLQFSIMAGPDATRTIELALDIDSARLAGVARADRPASAVPVVSAPGRRPSGQRRVDSTQLGSGHGRSQRDHCLAG